MHYIERFLLRQIASWIIVFTIAGYPVVAAISTIFNLDNRSLSIAVRSIFLLLALICIALHRHEAFSRSNSLFWLAWWVFWIAYIARLFIDQAFNPESLKLPVREYLAFMIGVCLAPAISITSSDLRPTIKSTPNKLLWIILIALALNLTHILFLQPDEQLSFESFRAESEVLNPITIGHLGVTAFLLTFWRFMQRPRIITLANISLLLPAGIATIAIVTSGSKGPLLSLICALAFYAILLPRRFFSIRSMLVILLACLALFFQYKSGTDFFLTSRLSDGVFEDAIRLSLLDEAIHLITQSPFLGNGIEPLWTYPHNAIIESFLVFGITTGLPFIYMLAHTLRKSITIAAYNREYFWVCLIFIQYLTGAMVSGSLYASSSLYMMMIIVVGISIPAKRLVQKAHANAGIPSTIESRLTA